MSDAEMPSATSTALSAAMAAGSRPGPSGTRARCTSVTRDSNLGHARGLRVGLKPQRANR